MGFWKKLKKKITLKGTIKAVAKAAPVVAAVATGGVGGALLVAGKKAVSAGVKIATAEARRFETATSGAAAAAREDVTALGDNFESGGTVAASAVTASSPVVPAGFAPNNMLALGAMVVVALLLLKGKK